MTQNLSNIDLTIVIVYLGVVFMIGMYAFYVQKTIKTSKKSESYFLASRNTVWLAVGFTIFSSNIGAEHFVGLAGTAANTGIAVGAFEWTAPFLLFILGYFISELYLSCNIVTTPEWLELRYNRIIRVYNALIMLFIFIFTVISATLYAGSVILDVVFGWNMWLSSIILIIITGLYVILGGLRAVIYTASVQAFILTFGGIVVGVYSFIEIGGIQGLRNEYNGTKNMHFFRSYDDPDWPSIGVGVTIILQGYYYWTCNQMLVQRVLCSKTVNHAKFGCIMAAMMKILPVFTMVFPGMVSAALYGDTFITDDPTSYDNAYPILVLNLLPKGLIGLVIASMLSALMSSLAAVYNSASTIITNDVYKIIYPHVADSTLVRIGRISSCIFIIVSLLWLPIIDNGSSELFNYIQQIYSYIQNPLAVVFFFGHFWQRANTYGAYAAIIVGTTLGLFRFIFGLILNNLFCHNIFCEIHYLYFGLFILVLCSFLLIAVSLLTPKPNPKNIDGLVWYTIHKNNKINTEYEQLIDDETTPAPKKEIRSDSFVEMMNKTDSDTNEAGTDIIKDAETNTGTNEAGTGNGDTKTSQAITSMTMSSSISVGNTKTTIKIKSHSNVFMKCIKLNGNQKCLNRIAHVWTAITCIILISLWITFA